MATTFTPNYNFTKPDVGGEPDAWGGLLNGNFDQIDTDLKAVSDVANGAVPKAGGTATGAITINMVNPALALNDPSGSGRKVAFSALSTGQVGLFDQAKSAWLMQFSATAPGNAVNFPGALTAGSLGTSGAFSAASASFTGTMTAGDVQATTGNIATLAPHIVGGGAGDASIDFTNNQGNMRVVLSSAGNRGFYDVTNAKWLFRFIAVSGAPGADAELPSGGLSVAGALATGGDITLNGGTGTLSVITPSGSPYGCSLVMSPGAAGARAYTITAGSGGAFTIRDTTGAPATRMTISALGTAIFTASVTATDFISSSDIRLKHDIRDHEPNERLAGLLRLVKYAWNSSGKEDVGLIAQEVQAIAPEYVTEGENGFLGVNYAKLALECVIGLAKRVEDLEGGQ